VYVKSQCKGKNKEIKKLVLICLGLFVNCGVIVIAIRSFNYLFYLDIAEQDQPNLFGEKKKNLN
jgi:hypothetical protein